VLHRGSSGAKSVAVGVERKLRVANDARSVSSPVRAQR